MNKRIALWDNLKFILIFFVVIGHFSEQLIQGGTQAAPYRAIFIFIYAFHMPLFFFVSGLFHKNKDIARKVCAFIGIGMLYKIVIYIVQRLTTGAASFHLLEEGGTPWFMFVLAVFILLTYLLQHLDSRVVLVTAVLLGCFAGYDASLGDFLCLSRIVVFFPFYFAGTMVNRGELEKLTEKKWVKVIGWVILIAWALVCIAALSKVYLLRPLLTGKNAYCKVDLPYVVLFRVLCYILSALLGFAWIAVMPRKQIPLLTDIGCRTMQIYFWHRPVLYLLVNLGLAGVMFASPMGQVLWLLMGAAIVLLLAWKPLRYPTDLFLNYRNNK